MLWGPLLVLVAAAGCGPNIVGAGLGHTDPVPCAAGAYPAGPFGRSEGDVLGDMAFAGYRVGQPTATATTAYRECVSLSQIRSEARGRYLLFNVAAGWCQQCRVEARVLPEAYRRWSALGGDLVVVLTDDANSAPADRRTLDAWVAEFGANHTVVHDPRAEIRNYFNPQTLPLNAIIRLEDMRIERVHIGTDASFFDFFDALLDN